MRIEYIWFNALPVQDLSEQVSGTTPVSPAAPGSSCYTGSRYVPSTPWGVHST